MIKKTRVLTPLLLARILITDCAHYRKNCPEPRHLPDELVGCNDHRSDS